MHHWLKGMDVSVDLCWSLFYKNFKLQSILNAAALLIGGLRKSSHISDFMQETLHWIPVPKRIQFKSLTLILNSLVGSSHLYTLRSAARGLL